jgi:hypothetical protein
MSVLLIDVCRKGGHKTGRCILRREICDGQVLCVEVSVNGFNGVGTGLLVPVLRRIRECADYLHSADGLCF